MVMLLGRFDQSEVTKATSEATSASGAAAPEVKPGSDPEDDPVEGLTLYFIDVTEQKHLETQFAQSQKMQAVGQLAGGVAHDFNNLLTAMIGFCDLLLLRSRPGDPAFADLMQIKQNANRAANLVRQLLAFSRQQSLQPRVLDITDVLVELSASAAAVDRRKYRAEFAHGRDLGLVKVDQGQLEQVVINLAVNARDAMPGGGRLTIRTENSRQRRIRPARARDHAGRGLCADRSRRHRGRHRTRQSGANFRAVFFDQVGRLRHRSRVCRRSTASSSKRAGSCLPTASRATARHSRSICRAISRPLRERAPSRLGRSSACRVI